MTADTDQRRRPRRRFQKRRKFCPFCADSDKTINYKDVATLRSFLTDRGRIKPRRKTGACARHQRQIAREIKRARHLALLPFTAEPYRG